MILEAASYHVCGLVAIIIENIDTGTSLLFLQGRFKAVMLIVTPCRSDMSAAGLSRYAHLADGRLHLALVRACTVLQYLQFLTLIPRMGARGFLGRGRRHCT